MPDVYSVLRDLDQSTQEQIAGVLELRGSDPGQQAMRTSFLDEIPIHPGSDVLEVGCGTGVLTRRLATLPGVGSVLGVDPVPFLLTRARELSAGAPNLWFEEADGASLPFDDARFDVVVFDSTLSHMVQAGAGLAEAKRVLRPGGVLAAFDGDYATATVALQDNDPLQVCVAATMANSVNDRWIVRRLPRLFRDLDFEITSIRSYGYVETGGGYVLTLIERGADFLAAATTIAPETAANLKAEAHRRVAEGTFFGHIAYGSVVGRKAG